MLSRRRFLAGGLALAMTALVAACESAIRSLTPAASPSLLPSPSPTAPPTEEPTPTATPEGMSLRQRIGQMLLVGFRGLTVEDAEPTRALIASGELGGVLLFSVDQPTGGLRNVESPEQLRALVSGLSAAAGTGAPLLVAIDQEGGQVARLNPTHGFPATPSAAEMGAGDPGMTQQTARSMAETLASAGVTLNLAPVVDLAINPDNPIIAAIDRSFSADPDVVISHAEAFIAGMHGIAIRCAAKHFPGQGSATGDTHQGVVDVTDVWTEQELEPFAALSASGAADAILTAHIFNANLDADHPATLSQPTVTGILRQQLRYDGVVISDDLQMGAITAQYGYEEAVALAIEAGIDVLLIANQIVYEPDIVERTLDIVEGLVRDGRIDEARIQSSVDRILRLKG
jgi:beta-N-acetylhexosaminidase